MLIYGVLYTHQKTQTLQVAVKQKAKATYRENSKTSVKIKTTFVSEMKTTIFYTVTCLDFLLADSSMVMSNFMLSVNYCSTDSVARFLSHKVLVLDLT